MLVGNVYKEYVRCGTPGCRCNRGERHGPYFYLRSYENGRRRKRYIRKADVAQVKEQCEAYYRAREEVQSQQQLARTHKEIITNMTTTLRELAK